MSNAPGYKSLRFGDADDKDNEGPPQLRSAILVTVQNIYRELAKTEPPPGDLDNWSHSAILSYRIEPVFITLLVMEEGDGPVPEARFKLVTDANGHIGSLEYRSAGKPKKRNRLPHDVNADFQAVREWVMADINRRGLNKPDATAARAAAKKKKAKTVAEDWQQKLKVRSRISYIGQKTLNIWEGFL